MKLHLKYILAAVLTCLVLLVESVKADGATEQVPDDFAVRWNETLKPSVELKALVASFDKECRKSVDDCSHGVEFYGSFGATHGVREAVPEDADNYYCEWATVNQVCLAGKANEKCTPEESRMIKLKACNSDKFIDWGTEWKANPELKTALSQLTNSSQAWFMACLDTQKLMPNTFTDYCTWLGPTSDYRECLTKYRNSYMTIEEVARLQEAACKGTDVWHGRKVPTREFKEFADAMHTQCQAKLSTCFTEELTGDEFCNMVKSCELPKDSLIGCEKDTWTQLTKLACGSASALRESNIFMWCLVALLGLLQRRN